MGFLLAAVAIATLGLVPAPRSVTIDGRCGPGVDSGSILAALRSADALDPGGRDLVRERWSALGVRPTHRTTVRVTRRRALFDADEADGYRLTIDRARITITSETDTGTFYALATLAQLVGTRARHANVPCARIADAPALRWRILSDDVSRGPLPTMRYFRERIRTIASLKMNGYSPYMENTFADPAYPVATTPDGITPAQLRELGTYARRFHVALIPEQQTFAHMHGVLESERYAALAELPHGYLLAPANPLGARLATAFIESELRSLGTPPPFFHIGSDEPFDLGRGRSAELVAARGEGAVFADHVASMASFVRAHGGVRPMVWDDAIVKHPELFTLLPKSTVFVNWHYGTESTYRPYIDRIARGGFDQMVAPGALNWNEIYPDLDAALTNIDRFVGDGKRSHVLGLFQTVWHDDGETLYEATWYPIAYAAASAWERSSVDRTRFATDFPVAFFGTDDPGFAKDLAALARCRTALRDHNPREYGDYLFWTDPFAPDLTANAERRPLTDDVLAAIRIDAEDAIAHLTTAPPPPLHANAAAVMALAARRYDALGRRFQIAREARGYYDDARANVGGAHETAVYRGLFVAKYLFWEERDAMLGLEPLVRAAWEYENRSAHEASVLERYHLEARRAIERADRLSDVVYRSYAVTKSLPTFDDAIALPPH